jgi:formate--tetrahydrofolate ligase
VHGGPFANIAHGCNSVIATKMALKMGDYTVTEAGFGADLGAEKFLDIKCRMAGLTPDAVVVVATVRALKMHGGLDKKSLATEDLAALERGVPNLLRHVSNIKNVYKLPCVVAVNRFPTDTDAEIEFIIDKCRSLGVNTVLSTVWAEGGKGGEALAREVVRLCEEEKGDFTFSYGLDCSIEEKITAVVKKIYGGAGVNILPAAKKQIATLTALGFDRCPVCIAKTQYSFSDDPTLLGAPEGFTVTVKNVKISAGAGFVVVLTGEIMTMPGLPKSPAAERIDVDENGKISGLF